MPAYDYTCPGLDCQTKAEFTFPTISAAMEATVKCPQCGRPMTRLISLPGVVFKGDGWTRSDSWIGGEQWDMIER